MLISSSIPVMAFSVTNGNKTFDKKWELSTTSDDGKGVLPPLICCISIYILSNIMYQVNQYLDLYSVEL